MCGRYTLRVPAERMASLFTLPELPPEFAPRYNIAPSQSVPVVGLKQDHQTRGLAYLKWGLVPGWANSPGEGVRPINARAEGIEAKATFRDAFRHKRCLLVIDGYYEWRPAAGKKVPHHVRFPDHRPFAVAGLWEHWTDDVTRLTTCCLVTVAANADVRAVHDRMPAVLSPDEYAAWLAPGTTERELKGLLRPFRAGELEPVRVGPRVGNPRHDGPECLAPAA